MSDILQALEAQASNKPDAVAILGSRERLTWRQFRDAVAALQTHFNEANTLGLHLQNSPAWIVADLAAMGAEVANVPLPIFFSDTQLRHAIEDAGTDLLVTDQPQRIASLCDVASIQTISIAGVEASLLRVNAVASVPSNIAKITYTSGSTGSPKGVMLSRVKIEQVAHSLRVASGANADDRAMVLLPLSILLENIGSVYLPILSGAQILVPDADELGIGGSSQVDARRLVETIGYYRPTALIVPPNLLKLLVGVADQLPDTLRFIAVGGAPVGRSLLAAADKAGLPVYQGYGLSECASVVALNTAQANRLGSVGRPLPHLDIRIDEQSQIRIHGLPFDGYLHDQNSDGDAIATGDLGYLDEDGFLYVTGRSRRVIISGYGRNISPEWVEAALTAHPAIAQAAVFGDEQASLSAVLVPGPDRDAGQVSQALAQVNSDLPDYARIGQEVIAEQPFTVSNGQLTAGGTPDSQSIAKRYGDQLFN